MQCGDHAAMYGQVSETQPVTETASETAQVGEFGCNDTLRQLLKPHCNMWAGQRASGSY